MAARSITVATPVHPKCTVCGLTVYKEEEVRTGVRDANDNPFVYHNTCFKCCHCTSVLTLASFAQEKGKIYCVQHFREIFGRLGKYDNLTAEKLDHVATPPVPKNLSVSSSSSSGRRSSVVTKPCAFAGCTKNRIGGAGPNFHYCAEHAQAQVSDNAPPVGYQGITQQSAAKPKKGNLIYFH